jgi:K+-transporting ATPase A subunit
VERVIYRLGGMDPGADQPWPHYIRSLLATSVAGIVGCTCSCGCKAICRSRWDTRE